MTLITDGGSTKCDWVLLDSSGAAVLKTSTKGLNPTVVPASELRSRILSNEELRPFLSQIRTVDFFGAGCGTATPRGILQTVLNEIFSAAEVQVREDLAAAVFSVTAAPGIVCILGTGSHSCFFDGERIHVPIPSLGYSVMDEGSGNYFGKRLLQDYFYKKMPTEIAVRFVAEFDLNPDSIKMNLYQKPMPNAYLATFAEFIFKEEKPVPYFLSLLKEGLNSFHQNRVLSFEKANEFPVHFVGSVAHFSKEIIAELLAEKGMKLGKIQQRPIDGLTEYYRNKIRTEANKKIF